MNVRKKNDVLPREWTGIVVSIWSHDRLGHRQIYPQRSLLECFHGTKLRQISVLYKNQTQKNPANVDFLQRIGRQQGRVSISSPSSLNTS